MSLRFQELILPKMAQCVNFESNHLFNPQDKLVLISQLMFIRYSSELCCNPNKYLYFTLRWLLCYWNFCQMGSKEKYFCGWKLPLFYSIFSICVALDEGINDYWYPVCKKLLCYCKNRALSSSQLLDLCLQRMLVALLLANKREEDRDRYTKSIDIYTVVHRTIPPQIDDIFMSPSPHDYLPIAKSSVLCYCLWSGRSIEITYWLDGWDCTIHRLH